MRLLLATSLILLASMASAEYLITTMHSDSNCSGTILGKRATNFFQPTQNCTTTLLLETCTQVGDNYAIEECVADPDLTPEISWVTVLFFESQSCADSPYAHYMGVPDTCLFYNYANTFTLTACASGKTNFKEGSTECDYSKGSIVNNVASTCTEGNGLGLKVICPGDFTPSSLTPTSAAPNAAPNAAAPNAAAPNAAPSSNAPTSAPSKAPAKASDAAALCASTLFLIAAIAF